MRLNPLTIAGMTLGLTTIAGAASAQTPIALWDMDPTGGNFPATLDLRTNFGQGTLFGAAPVLGAEDHLITFNFLGALYPAVADVAPASMYNASNPLVISGALPSTESFDAGAFLGGNGALFFPANQYGTEFGFLDSFTVEGFFKTDGDQQGAGRMQVVQQAEISPLRFSVVVNEPGPGDILFAVLDDPTADEGGERIFTAAIDRQNVADGNWWYFKAECDVPNLEIRLSITREDGAGETQVFALPADFMLDDNGADNGRNLFIGRRAFQYSDPDDRTFRGLIDDVQITSGLVSAADMLGNAPIADADDRAPKADTSVVARYSMNPVQRPGVVFATEDSKVSYDERGANHLWQFSNIPVFDPTPDVPDDDNDTIFGASSDVPPAELFANGNDGGSFSYDASTFNNFDGALLYSNNTYGNVVAFEGPFSVEMFFKTNGDLSQGGVLQLLNQGERFFRYGLTVNEASPGAVRFAINDGEGNIPTVDAAAGNYADGEWHYLLAQYDPDAGLNGELSLTVTSADGMGGASAETVTTAIEPTFQGLPTGNDGPLFIGRNTFQLGGNPRNFDGLIDEVQISIGLVPEADRLGNIGAVATRLCADQNEDGSLTGADFNAFLTNFSGGDPKADVNGDGSLTGADFNGWLTAFSAGLSGPTCNP